MDNKLRQLLRQAQESGDPRDKALYYRKLLQAGLISPWRLRLAAVLGDPASSLLYPDVEPLYQQSLYDGSVEASASRWMDALFHREDPTVALAAAALMLYECALESDVFYEPERRPALTLYHATRMVCQTGLLIPFYQWSDFQTPQCDSNTYWGFLCSYLSNAIGVDPDINELTPTTIAENLHNFFYMSIDLGIHSGDLIEQMCDSISTLIPYILGEATIDDIMPEVNSRLLDALV